MKNSMSILINGINFKDFPIEIIKKSNPIKDNLPIFENSIFEFDWKRANKIFIVHDLFFLKFIEQIHASSKLVAIVNFDVDSLKGSIEYVEHLESLKSGKLIYVVGGDVEAQVATVSELIDIEKYESWEPLVSSAVIQRDVDYFRIFYRKLAAILNIKSLSRATRINTTYSFLRNSLINAPLAYRKIPVMDFHEIQKNKPILIVAAGPSLNKQLLTLKKYQNIFTIIAVDTVWPILNDHGIVPDVIFGLDSEATPAWPTNGISERTCFSVDIGCGPSLVWSHNKNHIFSTTSVKIMNLMVRLGAYSDIIPTGGSVATSAFELAKFMGGNPIVLIGQDLALTGGKDHADGYLQQYDEEILKKRTDTGFDVEGYYGDKVRTERQLLFYKTWYESKIKEYSETMVINATEGGAKIQGAIQIPFKDVCSELEAFQKIKTFDFPNHDLTFNKPHVVLLIFNISLLIEKTEEFVAIGREGEALICRKKSITKEKLLHKIDLLNKKILNFDVDSRAVVDAFSQMKMEKIRFDVTMDTKPKSLDIAIEKYLNVYIGLQESGDLALVMLRDVKKFYERLNERGSYDVDLLDELLAKQKSLL